MHCEWTARLRARNAAGEQDGSAPVGCEEGVRFERRVMRPLSRAEIDVPSARPSIDAIRLRSALALPAAGSVVRARDHIVLLA
jgi:hypothetical protein